MVVVFCWLLVTFTLLGVSISIGFLLHWIWPQVELGTWILASLGACALAIHFLSRFLSSFEESLEGETVVASFPRWSARRKRRGGRPEGP